MNTPYVVSKEYADECHDRIIVARTSMIMGCPFFGILAARLKLVPNNTWCRTLAVDGKHLYYNVEFIMGIEDPLRRQEYEDKLKTTIDDLTTEQIKDALDGLSHQNLVAAICHEILHCAYNHFLRRGSRNPKKWNKAADYAINQIINRDKKMGLIKKSWLYNSDYEGKAAEEIYNILEELGDSDGGGGGTLDQHDIPQQDSNDNEDESVPKFTKDELESFMDSFKDAMLSAALADGAPKEIRDMIEEFKTPTIDWRSKLNRTIRSLIKNDVSYMMPSRRSWSTGFGSTGSYYGSPIYPGLKPDLDIDICVALDASGSISPEMLKDFLSEVIGMTKQFSQFKIRILTFDTSVYTVRDYVTGEEKKILEYPVVGGGGTLFTAVYDYMKNDNYCPKQLVMFTDGEPWGSWGDSNYCETLFVIHSNPKKEAPFGTTVHYNIGE
ncbi:Sll7028 protein [Yersinia phage fHe-Yen9-03]|uniref:Sll7028 protein n=1 Tax=Yersinia phage fHe-Yen9-03 TaxID=2052743 RepID=A0A2C9CYU5_9CAUD|nr:Sll7028 protein [Yersinia phage fHe-Yen9-03]